MKSNMYSSITHNLSYIITLLRPFKRHMFWGTCSVLALNLVQLSVPLILAKIVDSYSIFETNTDSSVSQIIRFSIIFLIVGLLVFGLRIIWRYLLIITPAYFIKREIKFQLFSHILKLSNQANRSHTVGEQISLISRETDLVAQAVSFGFMLLADGIFSILGVYTILLLRYQSIVWATLLLYPLLLVYVFAIMKRLGAAYANIQNLIAHTSEMTREMFQHIATIKGFNSEDYYSGKFYEKGNQIIKANLRISLFQGLLFPIAMLISSIGIVLVIYFGIQEIKSATASVGDLLAILTYLMQVSFPLMALGYSINLIQMGYASLKRIKTLLDTKTTLIENKGLSLDYSALHTLRLEHVKFSYPSRDGTEDANRNIKPTAPFQNDALHKTENFVLGPLSLTIPYGSWIGITGTIGSGKTTLAKLCVRIFDADSGHICLNEKDIQDFKLSQLRNYIVLQNQQFNLFSRTVLQNIAFEEEELDASQTERAIECGTLSMLENDVELLPSRWNTQIGETGILLSGGQKQRVALARVLFKDPPILILDDIFSGLDYNTSIAIIKNIKKIRNKKTTIFISHNLSVLSRTDTILVMDQGKIIEQGTHRELIQRKEGLYVQSWHEYLIAEGKQFE